MMKRSLMTLLAFASLSVVGTHAQFVGAIHNLFIEHGVYQVGLASAVPLFTPQGFLLSPGAGYPTVDNPVIDVHETSVGVITGSPSIVPLSLTTPAQPAVGFGGATTVMSSIVAPFVGFIWWPYYFISDIMPPDGTGSYNVSGGDVLFQNGPWGWFVRAGIFFPFWCNVPVVGAYAAGAMWLECTIYNALNIPVDSFVMSVYVGFDGLGPLPNVLEIDGPPSRFQYSRVDGGGTIFTGFGLVWRYIFIPPGGKVKVEGRLTLLADPDAEARFTDEFNNDPNVIANLPNMGYSAIPEPASMTALGVGLLALLARRRRWRMA